MEEITAETDRDNPTSPRRQPVIDDTPAYEDQTETSLLTTNTERSFITDTTEFAPLKNFTADTECNLLTNEIKSVPSGTAETKINLSSDETDLVLCKTKITSL